MLYIQHKCFLFKTAHLPWPSGKRLLLFSCDQFFFILFFYIWYLFLFFCLFFIGGYELQHTRLLCPSLSPDICSNSCPLSQWCYLTISSSAVPFSSCPQSFPASGSFPMSRLFASGGQSIGASSLATVLPMNIQGWFPLRFTGLVFL